MMALLMGPAGEGKPNKLIIVLEPENLERLRHGRPIVKPLSQFFPDNTDASKYELVLAYTPDIEWLQEQLKTTGNFGKAMDESLKRPAVFRRGDVAETMSRLL
jgi:hypothetical protein